MDKVRVNKLGGEAGPDIRPESKACLYEPKRGEEAGDTGAETSSRVRWEKRRRRREEEEREREGVEAPDDGPLALL